MGREGGPSPEDMGIETDGDDTLKNMADKKGKRGSRVKGDFKDRAKGGGVEPETQSSMLTEADKLEID